MVLRIDEAELRAKLFEHKKQIGFGPIANGVVIIIEGLFLHSCCSHIWTRPNFSRIAPCIEHYLHILWSMEFDYCLQK